MLSAIGKLIKFIIILIAIIIGITYFTGTEVSLSDNQASTSETQKTTETISSPKSIQIPENAYATALVSRGWKCITDYEVSGNNCIRASENINDSSKQQNESSSKSTTKKVKVDSKPDRWWEKTDKYAICYGRVTQAHKDNGLHDRDRDKSIEIKKELCKIAATSTTGEGSFWIE
jgi:hypothetical protein